MCSLSRKVTYFLTASFLILYFTALLLRWNNSSGAYNGTGSCSNISNLSQQNIVKRKTILFLPHWWQPHYPYLKEANKFCPRCRFTENQAAWEDSDAVVFHGRMLPEKIPSRRKPSELWVFMLFEALSGSDSDKLIANIRQYDGLFNWTMTYRRDSDVPMPYGRFIKINDTPRPNYNQSWAYIRGARGKSTYQNQNYSVTPSVQNFRNRSFAAWIASRCNSSNKRESIVSKLRKYVPSIHTYGRCGDHKCVVPKGKALTGIDCRLQISTQYKFYLSFENGNCLDYVTEKYFDVVATNDMVPVVFGGANYKKLFPKNSFIDVNDFKGPKELGEYLKYVGTTPTKWLEYFAWRKHHWVQNNRFISGYCDLCNKLWELEKTSDGKAATYPSVWDWWLHRNDSDRGAGPACEMSVTKWNKKV